MATKIPITGIIKINDKEVKNTFWGLQNEMKRIERELKKLTVGTEEYEKKSQELRAVSKEWQKVNKNIKEQKGYLDDNRSSVDKLDESYMNLKGAFDALKAGDFKGFATQVMSGFSGMTGAARTFFVTLMSNPITAIIAILGALAVAVGLVVKKFFDYNVEIEEADRLTKKITKTIGDTADYIRNRATSMEKVFGKDFQENVKAADKLVHDFKVSYKEAFDLIEDGLIKGADANGEFFESIEEYSVFFEKAGYSAQQFIDVLNSGADLKIYKDKLPDAIKEATLSLTEQTKPVRDALINAFGQPFSDELLAKVKTGEITVKQALDNISEKAEETELNQQQLAQLTADLFKGAGEDVGGAAKMFEALDKANKKANRTLSESEKKMKKLADSTTEVQLAKDKLFKSDVMKKFITQIKLTWNKVQVIYYKYLTKIKDLFTTYFGSINRIIKEFGISFSDVFSVVKKHLKFFAKGWIFSMNTLIKIIETLTDHVIAFKRSFVYEFKEIIRFLDDISTEVKQILQDMFNPTKTADTSKIKKAWKRFASTIGNSFNEEMKKIKLQRELREFAKNMSLPPPIDEPDNDSGGGGDDEPTGGNKGKSKAKAIKIGGEKALKTEQEWADKLIKARNENWDLLHSLDAKNMEAEIKLIKEHTKRKLDELERENRTILNEKTNIQNEINRLLSLKPTNDKEKNEITESVKAYRASLTQIEELLKSHEERKELIESTGSNEINKIREKYIFESIKNKEIQFAKQQELDRIRFDTELANLEASEQKKLKLQREFDQKQLNEQTDFLNSLTNQIKNLIESGDFDELNLRDIILTDEGKAALQSNLEDLGLSLEQIKLIMAQIRGDDEFEGVGIIGGDVLGMSPEKWEQLFENLDQWQGKVELVIGVTRAMQQAWSTFHDLQMKKEEESLRRFEANTNRKKEALSKQLEQGYINQKEYDAKVKKLDESLNKRKAELAYKQAKYERQQALISAVVNTAVGVTSALKAGVIGPVLAGIVAAMGAAQIALITSQPLPPKQGYAKGGFTEGLGWKDESGHEVAGVVHKDEWVAPKWMLENPVTARAIHWLEAKRTGKDEPFAGGGYTEGVAVENKDVSEQEDYRHSMYAVLLRFTELMEEIESSGIRAYVVGDEKEGKKMKEAIDSYNQLKNKNRR